MTSFADPTLNAAGVSDAALLAAFTAANGGSAVLAPGASVTFTINDVSLTLDDGTPGPDPFVNTVTVNATDDEGTAATDTDTATIMSTECAGDDCEVGGCERRHRLQRQRDGQRGHADDGDYQFTVTNTASRR